MGGFDLSGRTVLVIGGSSGIGRAVALAARSVGAAVHVAARGRGMLDRLRASDAAITTHTVDAKDFASLQALFAAVGIVDHVAMTVHETAASLGIYTAASSMKLEPAFEYVDGKFWSQYRIVQAALPHLSEGGSLTLTSGVASRAGMANHSVISAVNAAVEASARQLAKELAPWRINVVAPGVTETTIHDAMSEAALAEFFRTTTASVPLQRIGKPDEIALAYLLSMACSYLTGEILNVSGGRLVA